MIQAIKNNIGIAIVAAVLVLVAAVVPSVAYAAPSIEGSLDCGANIQIGETSGCSTASGTTDINDTIVLIINIFSGLVAAVSVIMIIFGGFRYVTSGGDSGNISNAKNTIIYAIVGLVIVAFAQAIVFFVLDSVNP